MAAEDIDWNLYRTFLYVIREGSFSGAARALGMSQPTVTRHVEGLEAALGIKLFTRSTDGLLPTPVAKHIAASVQAMSSLSGAIMREASHGATAALGTIRLAASKTVGVEILPRMIATLRESLPDLAVELILSNRNEDVLRGAADIAIRMKRPEQLALIATKIGVVGMGLFAHRHYVERHGMPLVPDQLADYALIGYDTETAFIDALNQLWGVRLSKENFAFRSDCEHAQLAALRSGVGIGACQAGIARRDPDLIPVLPHAPRLELEMWLVTHEDLRLHARVKQVFDCLAQQLGRYLQD